MQRRKLGTAVIWMVCLLGLVAVVWSRPPMNGSRAASHPPLALAAPADDPQSPLPQNANAEPLPTAEIPLAMDAAVPIVPALANEAQALPSQHLVREMKPVEVSLRFEGQRLFVTVKQSEKEKGIEAEYRIAADYHLTKDSMLYGIVTSAEVNMSTGDPGDRIVSDTFAQQLFDQPFAIRYRLDEGTLTVKDFKMAPIAGDPKAMGELKTFILGSYRAAPAPMASL